MSNDWMQTFSGKCFRPLDFSRNSFSIVDIVHAMSMLVRFGGHVRVPYSVGQHTLRVVAEVHRRCLKENIDKATMAQVMLEAWFHDATEALGMSDIVRPIKHRVELEGYRVLEDKVMEGLRKAFDCSDPKQEHLDMVKWADLRALAGEARDLLNTCDQKWSLRSEPHPDKIEPLTYGNVKKELLFSYYTIVDMLDRMEKTNRRVVDLRLDLQQYVSGLKDMERGSTWKSNVSRFKNNVYYLEGLEITNQCNIVVLHSDMDDPDRLIHRYPLFLWEEYISKSRFLLPAFYKVNV